MSNTFLHYTSAPWPTAKAKNIHGEHWQLLTRAGSVETPYLPQMFLTAQPKSGDSRNFLWTDYDLTVLPLCFWPVKALGSLTVCGTARTFPSAGWRCRRCCEELGWPGLPPGPLAAAGKHWARGSDWVNEEWWWGGELSLWHPVLSDTQTDCDSLLSLSSRLSHASPHIASVIMLLASFHSLCL